MSLFLSMQGTIRKKSLMRRLGGDGIAIIMFVFGGSFIKKSYFFGERIGV